LTSSNPDLYLSLLKRTLTRSDLEGDWRYEDATVTLSIYTHVWDCQRTDDDVTSARGRRRTMTALPGGRLIPRAVRDFIRWPHPRATWLGLAVPRGA
jgi:hypothetical protein